MRTQLLVTWPPQHKTHQFPSRPGLTWPPTAGDAADSSHAPGSPSIAWTPFLVPEGTWQSPCWNPSLPQDVDSRVLSAVLGPLPSEIYTQLVRDVQTQGFKCLLHVANPSTPLGSPGFLPESRSVDPTTCLPSPLGVQKASPLTSSPSPQGPVITFDTTQPPSLPSYLLPLPSSIFLLRKSLNVKVDRILYPCTQCLDSRCYHSCLIYRLFTFFISIFKICLKVFHFQF